MKAIPQVRCPLSWYVSVCAKFIKTNQKRQSFLSLQFKGPVNHGREVMVART